MTFKIKQSAGALIGNSMQFYDFTIYAFLAPDIARYFFSIQSQYLSYLLAIGVFSSGYIVRPVGALLFGYIGDSVGRSKALSSTIILTATSTFLIGILPDCYTIGYAAPLLLISLRLLQGLSVSGEEGGAVVLLIEKNSLQQKGFIGSIVISSILFGIVLGAIVCSITSIYLSNSGSWVWRVPFLLSLPIGFIATKLRFSINDFELFSEEKKKKAIYKMPTSELFKRYKPHLLYGISIVSFFSISTCILIVNLPFILQTLGVGNISSLYVVVLTVSIVACLAPLFGKIVDSHNPYSCFFFSGITMIIIFPMSFILIQVSSGFLTLVIFIIFTSIATSMISATIFANLVDIFPFGVRYSGVSFVFNMSITIFSSSTPLLLTFLEGRENGFILSAIYLFIITLFMLFLSKRLIKKIQKTNFEYIGGVIE